MAVNSLTRPSPAVLAAARRGATAIPPRPVVRRAGPATDSLTPRVRAPASSLTVPREVVARQFRELDAEAGSLERLRDLYLSLRLAFPAILGATVLARGLDHYKNGDWTPESFVTYGRRQILVALAAGLAHEMDIQQTIDPRMKRVTQAAAWARARAELLRTDLEAMDVASGGPAEAR